VKKPFKGWSVIAAQKIEKGQFVSEYLGEVISVAEARRREKMNRAARTRANYILVFREWLYVYFISTSSIC
jgi:SET domain-containing protein